jgi:hypothetical protein
MALRIDYQSEGFPPGLPPLSGHHTLTTSWNDLLWAAITVGRPNRQFVFQHGTASVYEAIFRLSLTRMALEQQAWGWRLRRTAAARTLDPTEKGAVNYFLGLTICKLFAAELLDAPWMLHLDVFRPALDVQLASRSRPDLVGQTQSGQWMALECKGRISPPSSAARRRAKQQAMRVASVGGTAPAFHIGGIAYFKNDVLQFYWRDPEPEPEIRNPIRVPPPTNAWRHYYRPALELVQSSPTHFAQMREEPVLMPVEEADIEIGIEPEVLRRLAAAEWEEAREAARSLPVVETAYHADGIAVVAGPSWFNRFADSEG